MSLEPSSYSSKGAYKTINHCTGGGVVFVRLRTCGSELKGRIDGKDITEVFHWCHYSNREID